MISTTNIYSAQVTITIVEKDGRNQILTITGGSSAEMPSGDVPPSTGVSEEPPTLNLFVTRRVHLNKQVKEWIIYGTIDTDADKLLRFMEQAPCFLSLTKIYCHRSSPPKKLTCKVFQIISMSSNQHLFSIYRTS